MYGKSSWQEKQLFLVFLLLRFLSYRLILSDKNIITFGTKRRVGEDNENPVFTLPCCFLSSVSVAILMMDTLIACFLLGE